jgi:hypothetical protein
VIRFEVKKQANGISILTGATLGDRHAASVRQLVLAQAEEQPTVLFDFKGLDFVSSSYIKAAVLVFVGEGISFRGSERYAFPVVSNVDEQWRDELGIVCRSEELPALEVQKASENSLLKARLVGEVDSTVLRTLDTLGQVGSGTAAQLAEAAPQEGINLTAWNNRLAELFRLRLAHRVKEGRFLIYKPVAKDITYG